MNLNIKTTTDVAVVAGFLADAILRELKSGSRVLFFATGGSSVSIGVKLSELLRAVPEQNLLENLTITLTDERYGPVGHADSNWQQMLEKGFSLPGAKLLPVLSGEDFTTTVQKFNENLERELKDNQYKIGLFGVGKDGHTSGVLPESTAVDSEDYASGYETPTFSRITTTPKAIEMLDVAVVWMQGSDKWPVLMDLEKENIEITKQPAQILKKVPSLTIFTDYQK